VKTVINPRKARKKSFELTLQATKDSLPTLIWSGMGRGPPNRLRFPADTDMDALMKDVKRVVQSKS